MSRNKFKFRREIIAAGGIASTGGIQIGAASTFDSTVTITGVATLTASPVLTAGITALKAPIVCSTLGYLADHVQSLTAADCERTGTTGTLTAGYGVTKWTLTKAAATGAANFQCLLGNPVKAGVHHYVLLTRATGASTFEVWLSNESSAQTFYGTTADGIKLTTDWVSPNPAGFHFVGITTNQWACVTVNGLQSTQWSYTGTTFSAT
jgi:hypothetical protein